MRSEKQVIGKVEEIFDSTYGLTDNNVIGVRE